MLYLLHLTKYKTVKRSFFILFLLLVLLLSACTAQGSATTAAVPTYEPSVSPIPTQTAPTETHSGEMAYKGDGYTIQVEDGLTLFENERPSVDGVITPLPDSVALQDDNFILIITTFDIEEGIRLADFVNSNQECMNISPGMPTTVGNLAAMIFIDTPCGMYGTTYLYALAGNIGFRFAVESPESYADIQADVQSIMDSFQSTTPPPASVHIEHDGISLTYDPTLLGDHVIQDISATADQGMFEAPTPAHNWIGFAPPGIQRDLSNHWILL